MPEARDVPFLFSRAFAFAYEGIHVVRYQADERALVSAACARSATEENAGRVMVAVPPALQTKPAEPVLETKPTTPVLETKAPPPPAPPATRGRVNGKRW